MSVPAPQPFTLHVPDADIADSGSAWRARAGRDEPPLRAVVDRHEPRLSCKSLRRLLAHGFDWRAWEAKLNGFRQFTLPIGGIDLHFIHEPAREPDADAAADLARLARLGVRVPQAHPAADRALHRGGAVAARLHALVQAGAAALRRRARSPTLRRADERRSAIGASACRAATGAASSPRCWAIAIRSALTGIHLNLLAVRRDPAMLPNPTPRRRPTSRSSAISSRRRRATSGSRAPAADARLRR